MTWSSSSTLILFSTSCACCVTSMSRSVASALPEGWLCTRMTAPALVTAAVLTKSFGSKVTESRVPKPMTLFPMNRLSLVRRTAYRCSYCLCSKGSYLLTTWRRDCTVSGSCFCISASILMLPSSYSFVAIFPAVLALAETVFVVISNHTNKFFLDYLGGVLGLQFEALGLS